VGHRTPRPWHVGTTQRQLVPRGRMARLSARRPRTRPDRRVSPERGARLLLLEAPATNPPSRLPVDGASSDNAGEERSTSDIQLARLLPSSAGESPAARRRQRLPRRCLAFGQWLSETLPITDARYPHDHLAPRIAAFMQRAIDRSGRRAQRRQPEQCRRGTVLIEISSPPRGVRPTTPIPIRYERPAA
jgi:hypothetical protein